jgi:putative ABC transport system substrate-binding protein
MKKLFRLLLIIAFLGAGAISEAQQPPKIPRIGYVSGPGGPNNPSPSDEAFQQGLRDLGYIAGKNILVEYRYAEGNLDRLPGLVAELVQLKVDVLFVSNLPAIRAAKEATKTIPIVMVTPLDPVATGLIDSLAHPGGNLTGLATLGRELSGKRLQLLKEAVPGASRVGVLWDSNAPGPVLGFKEYEAAARALKIPLQSLEVRGPKPDLESAFQAAAKSRTTAIITITNPVLGRYKKQIADLAITNRKPSMCENSEYVEVGCLMSYATNNAESYRRAAVFVDKILKGSKPQDLPVEQPMKFEFIVNLKTAKQIGVTIEPNVLVRANKVIR